SDIVIGLRAVKSASELHHLQKAAYFSDIGMLAALAAAQPSRTENDIAAAASEAMILVGSEYFSTAPLVATGERTGLARAVWRRAKIAPGDVVTIELAGVYARYSAPLSRSVSVGKPSGQFIDLAEAGRECLATLMAKVEIGRPIGELAKSIRRKLRPLEAYVA